MKTGLVIIILHDFLHEKKKFTIFVTVEVRWLLTSAGLRLVRSGPFYYNNANLSCVG